MRVFSKKKLEFTNPDSTEKAQINISQFGNLPEWVKADPLFAWAVAEGSLEVFGEDKPEIKKSPAKKADAGSDHE